METRQEELAREFSWEFAFRKHHAEIKATEMAIFYSFLVCLVSINPFRLSERVLTILGCLYVGFALYLVVRRIQLEIKGKGKFHL